MKENELRGFVIIDKKDNFNPIGVYIKNLLVEGTSGFGELFVDKNTAQNYCDQLNMIYNERVVNDKDKVDNFVVRLGKLVWENLEERNEKL